MSMSTPSIGPNGRIDTCIYIYIYIYIYIDIYIMYMYIMFIYIALTLMCDIVIKPADKGSFVVVQNRAH